MMDTKLRKFGIWSLFILIILTFGLRLFYFGTFFLIKRVDPTIFCRHASDNMYADDIYFSAEAEETGILSDFNEKIDGFQEVVNSCIISSNNYELRLFLDEHIEEVLAVAKENNIYIDYLKNKGSSLECLSEYIHNMAKLDDNILQMAMYLSFVVICIVSLTKFKYRKSFYVASAIVYLIAMTSIFSNGLTDYIVSNIFAFVAKINKETFTYIDMNIVKEYFLDTLKESMMTVVIFDTIFQFKQSERNTKRIKDIRYVYQSLDMQIAYLRDIYNSSDKYIARLKVPSYCIEKECYKEAKKWGKALKRQKVKNSYYVKYKTRYETNISLYEKLQWIRTNCNEAYSSEYYVNYLQQIKELMIECGYNSI